MGGGGARGPATGHRLGQAAGADRELAQRRLEVVAEGVVAGPERGAAGHPDHRRLGGAELEPGQVERRPVDQVAGPVLLVAVERHPEPLDGHLVAPELACQAASPGGP